MIQLIRDNFSKYWFYGSTLLIAVMWFIIDRRGRQLSKLLSDSAFQLLQQKLVDIDEKSKESDDKFKKAKDEYETIKRNHGDLLKRIGMLNDT